MIQVGDIIVRKPTRNTSNAWTITNLEECEVVRMIGKYQAEVEILQGSVYSKTDPQIRRLVGEIIRVYKDAFQMSKHERRNSDSYPIF